jgi:II/X family phage/plasmid replication protein
VIDWLTFRASTAPHDPLANGAVMKFDREQNTEWIAPARLPLIGSYDASITVRSLDRTMLEVSGNPAKFLQGHNLWGSDFVPGLAAAMCDQVEEMTGLEIRNVGSFSRVDIAGLLDVGSPELVKEIIRALGAAGTLRHRGKGQLVQEGTVYWGKHSRRWSLKVYDKQREVLSTKSVSDVPTVAALASGKLRVELVLRGMELKALNARTLEQWSMIDPMRLLVEFLQSLELPDQSPRLDVAALPRHLRAPFMQWAQGDDLRTLYPKPTFYRYRRALLEWNVDISVPPAEPMTHTNEILDSSIGYAHLPDIRTLGFWQPSAAERALLPTFEAGPVVKSA